MSWETRLLLPVTAVAVAAGLVSCGQSTGSGQRANAQKAPDQATVRVLRDASAVAGRVPPRAAPNSGQWIYSKVVQYEYPSSVTSSEQWITFAGAKTADHAGASGPFVVHTSPIPPLADITSDPLGEFNKDVTPQTAYYAVASLPAAPRQLLDVVAKAAGDLGAANLWAGTPILGLTPENKSQLEFDYAALLVWNAAAGVGAPPAAEAAVFRAMAAIPGVTVQQDITDAAGARAIGVSGDGGYDQLLLDPVSYQVIGLRQLSNGIAPKVAQLDPMQLAVLPSAERQQVLRKMQAALTWPRKGIVVLSMAYARVTEVSGPGVR